MLFNSLTFALFFSCVLCLYFFSRKNFKLQNALLLAASCVFYGWWDWRFLGLLFFSTVLNYGCSLMIEKAGGAAKRKLILAGGICFNLFILGLFKYTAFFGESFSRLAGALGFEPRFITLQIMLPIGISFYTFQQIGYIVDVYSKKTTSVKNLLDYSLFVVFFPQLIAGPILRASEFFPQLNRPRIFLYNQFQEGGRLLAWGLFKKVVVADYLAVIADQVFGANPPYGGGQVIAGAYAFTFQIYCDFSGYSDMARGMAKMMGFQLPANFNLPFFVDNPSDFWKRWHITLSEWFRDYLYIPLGRNCSGNWIAIRNIMVTMSLAGLWHGAAWTYVFWGIYHGFLIGIFRWLRRDVNWGHAIGYPRRVKVFKIVLFFQLTVLGMLFFRAQSFTQITQMAYGFVAAFQVGWAAHAFYFLEIFIFAGIVSAVEFFQYGLRTPVAETKVQLWARWGFYYLVLLALFFLKAPQAEFVYFKF